MRPGWSSGSSARLRRRSATMSARSSDRPFGAGEPAGSKLSVVFLKSAPDPAMRRNIETLRVATDDFHVHGREVYWLCRGGRMSESPVGARFGKVLGTNGTMRNVTTIRKLVARHARPPAPT